MGYNKKSNRMAGMMRAGLCVSVLVALGNGCSDLENGDGDETAVGNIEGTVFADDGTAVAGASVVALDGETEVASTSTDGNGMFVLTDLAAGLYIITVSADGFEDLDTGIDVIAGQVANTQFVLVSQ